MIVKFKDLLNHYANWKYNLTCYSFTFFLLVIFWQIENPDCEKDFLGKMSKFALQTESF